MRGITLPSSPSRIKGRASLLRRLRALLIAAHRYGQHRAASRDDVAFAGALVEGLAATLAGAAPDHRDVGRLVPSSTTRPSGWNTRFLGARSNQEPRSSMDPERPHTAALVITEG